MAHGLDHTLREKAPGAALDSRGEHHFHTVPARPVLMTTAAGTGGQGTPGRVLGAC
ncbi:hypothetical protein EJ065_0202 [Corallococcus coralloides]|uniref:Uncharacterized protein n=1 Tax=Corallococcus coralloides TaxID=184914 RepID=A0A410RIQ3_CORCK|nr:hypothetical protein EJ065_0202 [Corallococcus coralloides]